MHPEKSMPFITVLEISLVRNYKPKAAQFVPGIKTHEVQTYKYILNHLHQNYIFRIKTTALPSLPPASDSAQVGSGLPNAQAEFISVALTGVCMHGKEKPSLGTAVFYHKKGRFRGKHEKGTKQQEKAA